MIIAADCCAELDRSPVSSHLQWCAKVMALMIFAFGAGNRGPVEYESRGAATVTTMTVSRGELAAIKLEVER
jgi:hypothetical protein